MATGDWGRVEGGPFTYDHVRDLFEGTLAFDEGSEGVWELGDGIQSARLFDQGVEGTLGSWHAALEELQNRLHPSVL